MKKVALGVPDWNAFSSGANVFNRKLWSVLSDVFPQNYYLTHKPAALESDEFEAVILDSLFLEFIEETSLNNASIILIGHFLKNYRPDIYTTKALSKEKRLLRALNGIICSGQPALERCTNLLEDQYCFLVQPGMDELGTNRSKVSNPTTPLQIIITSNLVKEKDLLSFLRQTKEYMISHGKPCSAEITVIGDRNIQPGYAEQCLSLMTDMKDEDWSVHYRSPMERDRYLQMLSRADLYLHPALFESYGMSIVEATQLGIPVLCHRDANAAGAVQDGHNGFVCETIDQVLDRWWMLMARVGKENKWPFEQLPEYHYPSWREQAYRLHDIVYNKVLHL